MNLLMRCTPPATRTTVSRNCTGCVSLAPSVWRAPPHRSVFFHTCRPRNGRAEISNCIFPVLRSALVATQVRSASTFVRVEWSAGGGVSGARETGREVVRTPRCRVRWSRSTAGGRARGAVAGARSLSCGCVAVIRAGRDPAIAFAVQRSIHRASGPSFASHPGVSVSQRSRF